MRIWAELISEEIVGLRKWRIPDCLLAKNKGISILLPRKEAFAIEANGL